MTELSLQSAAMGVVLLGLGAVGVAVPAAGVRAVKAFPRSRWPAWVLLAIDLMWAGWLIYIADLGRFTWIKTYLYVLVPISFYLIIHYMAELLAPRALGGLLLLIAAPVLSTARFHDSAFRYVIVVLTYALVIWGMVLVLSPYRFRRLLARCCEREGRFRGASLVVAAVGVLLLALAGTVFRG